MNTSIRLLALVSILSSLTAIAASPLASAQEGAKKGLEGVGEQLSRTARRENSDKYARDAEEIRELFQDVTHAADIQCQVTKQYDPCWKLKLRYGLARMEAMNKLIIVGLNLGSQRAADADYNESLREEAIQVYGRFASAKGGFDDYAESLARSSRAQKAAP